MASEHKHNDAGISWNSDKPHKSREALPLREKANVLQLVRKRNRMLTLPGSMVRKKRTVWFVTSRRRKKKSVPVSVVTPQTAKVHGHSA